MIRPPQYVGDAAEKKEDPMSHSITGPARALALTVAALAAVPVLAGTAAAAPAELYAPYARAAAQVDAAGNLTAAKNVSSARRVGAAAYCIVVSDPDITLKDAVVMGTVNAGLGTYSIDVRNYPTSTCGNAADTITAYTAYSTASNPVAFTLAVL
jgi:hypothetical protein